MDMPFGGILGLIWLVIIIWAIVKVVKSSASGVAKVLWVLALIIFPLVGFIVWLIVGPKG